MRFMNDRIRKFINELIKKHGSLEGALKEMSRIGRGQRKNEK